MVLRIRDWHDILRNLEGVAIMTLAALLAKSFGANVLLHIL